MSALAKEDMNAAGDPEKYTAKSIVLITLFIMTGLLVHYLDTCQRYLNGLVPSITLADTSPRPSYIFL